MTETTQTRIYLQCPATPKTPWGLWMNTHEQIRMAQRIGAHGIDWWPYRIPLIELGLGQISKEDLLQIGACHMSFRGETPLMTTRELVTGNIKGAAFHASLTALMPYYYSSFQAILKLNQQAGRSIPSVIYLFHYWNNEVLYPHWKDLSLPLAQPTQEYVDRWGVIRLTDFPEYAAQTGIQYCLDLFHMNYINKPNSKEPIGTWQQLMATLMPHTKLIHLGAGRPDFMKEQREAGINTMEWLYNLLEPVGYKGRIWQMLAWIKAHGYSQIPIVLEIPSSGLYEVQKETMKSPFLSKDQYFATMNRIVGNILTFMDQSKM